MSKYLSDAHVAKYLSKLHAHTASSLRKAQKWHVPFVITNTINQTYLSTYDEQNGVDAIPEIGRQAFRFGLPSNEVAVLDGNAKHEGFIVHSVS